MSPRETTKNSTSISTPTPTSTSPVQPNADAPKASTPEIKQEAQSKTEPANAEPLAPPPRPAAVAGTPDYFSGIHNLNTETNPFEYSFAGNAGPPTAGLITPGGTKLPSVAALTSPALGNFWASSAGLRSGPLSPAMLAGPAKDDYFGDSYTLHRGGSHPQPRESDLRGGFPENRTGLTPGAGGSMFLEPSSGGSSMFNSLAAGGATPGTLDFQRTAMTINARKIGDAAQLAKITSQPQDVVMNGMDAKPPPQFRQQENETNDAANGLFLLANAHNGPQQTNHYDIAPQNTINAPPMPMGRHSQETSPRMGHRHGDSISTNSGGGQSEGSEEEQSRPTTRGKNKRSSIQDNQTNGRRKAADQPKAPANKKSKANNGMSLSMSIEPASEEEEPDMSKDEFNANGKKMTDEEKRKNFLERNRVAALKCRQRKKQWLANLQQKVEIYAVENDHLNATVSQLRDEVVNLKTLLLAHKDCPVTHTQGLNGMHGIQQIIDNFGNAHMNPYGMAMNQQHQQQLMVGQGYPTRRES